MKINGIVTKVSSEYPYQIEVGKHKFISHFKFSVGQKIKLEFDGEEFDAPWPRGFIICSPNGLSEYTITDKDMELMNGDNVARHCCRIPYFIQPVITEGTELSWISIGSFYEYHYSAKYDPARKVLITNYPIRQSF